MAIDWRAVWMMLPKRRFSAAELQRAIPEPPSRSVQVAVLLNIALGVVAYVWAFGGDIPPLLSVALAAASVLLVAMLALAWRDPSHRLAQAAYYVLPLALGLGTGLAMRRIGALSQAQVLTVALVALIASLMLWFAIVYRHKYVEMRLAELDERERSADMARQLAQAQIQPHFLFNSLASLQHWVHARDDRAAPMLDALLGFLRATLPLFDRRTIALADEAQAVRQYLAVMQLRLGERLRWQVDIEPRAGAARLPPGLLLTLVENAIEHGVQPSLRGGEVRVAARADAGRLAIDVRDTGPGLDSASGAPGVGLANARARLLQAFGATATLALESPPEGGCAARIDCPFDTEKP